MLTVLLALLVQSSTISGSLVSPQGSAAPATAQVVLLPSEYAQMFNAEAQLRLDQYWSSYKREFAENKEQFSRAFAVAYQEALELVVARMRNSGKADVGSLIRSAPGGRFEFRGVPHGDYKIVATSTIQGTTYVWTEALQVTPAPIFLQMKNRVP
jgi:hypothetical protein